MTRRELLEVVVRAWVRWDAMPAARERCVALEAACHAYAGDRGSTELRRYVGRRRVAGIGLREALLEWDTAAEVAA